MQLPATSRVVYNYPSCWVQFGLFRQCSFCSLSRSGKSVSAESACAFISSKAVYGPRLPHRMMRPKPEGTCGLRRFAQFGADISYLRNLRKTPVDGQKECGRLPFSPVDLLKECMPSSKSEVLQGTLDLLVLKTLDSMGPMHGFGIALRIQQVSEELLQLNQGTLYPGLLRLAQRGWIESKWGVSENNRKAKYYSLTRAGRKQLEQEAESWERMAGVINRILGRVLGRALRAS